MRRTNIVIIFTKTNFSLEMLHQISPTGFPADAGGVFCCLVSVVGIFLTFLLSTSHNDLYNIAIRPLRYLINRRNKIQLAMTSQTMNLLQTLLPHCSPVSVLTGHRQGMSQVLAGS